MAKTKKTKPFAVKKQMDPATLAMLRRIALHVAIVISVVGASLVGLHYARRDVDRRLAFYDRAPKIVLEGPPRLDERLPRRADHRIG